MKAATKKHIAYAVTIALALVGIYLTLKAKGSTQVFNPAAAGSDQPGVTSSGGATGAPTIELVGANYPPLNINLQTMPGSSYTGGTNQLYLPVISNYIQQGNGGCGSCAQGNGALLGSEMAANAAITAAMLAELGYVNVNGHLEHAGYYNTTGLPNQYGNPTGVDPSAVIGIAT